MTDLVYNSHFVLLAEFFVDHVHLWRTYHCFSKRDDRLRSADFNFSKPEKQNIAMQIMSLSHRVSIFNVDFKICFMEILNLTSS